VAIVRNGAENGCQFCVSVDRQMHRDITPSIDYRSSSVMNKLGFPLILCGFALGAIR
jgi:hypothetical protein